MAVHTLRIPLHQTSSLSVLNNIKRLGQQKNSVEACGIPHRTMARLARTTAVQLQLQLQLQMQVTGVECDWQQQEILSLPDLHWAKINGAAWKTLTRETGNRNTPYVDSLLALLHCHGARGSYVHERVGLFKAVAGLGTCGLQACGRTSQALQRGEGERQARAPPAPTAAL